MKRFGKGYCNAVWKDRACYTFDRYGAYIYVSAKDAPMVLNGTDYGILKAGDSRANKVVAMKRFHNELMVWQEELGVDGGCVTLFEGYSPSTFGKLVLSSKIGGMNAKSVTVVDGVLNATATDKSKPWPFSCPGMGFACATGSRSASYQTTSRTISTTQECPVSWKRRDIFVLLPRTIHN